MKFVLMKVSPIAADPSVSPSDAESPVADGMSISYLPAPLPPLPLSAHEAARLVSTDDVAVLMGISRRTLVRWVTAGEFPRPSIGGRRRGDAAFWKMHVVVGEYHRRLQTHGKRRRRLSTKAAC